MNRRTFATVTVLAALVVLGACSASAEGVKNIHPKEAGKQMDTMALVLDVRTSGEWRGTGALPGARLLPINRVEAVMTQLAAFKDKPVLVYCAVGARSSKVANLLVAKGFTKVHNLAGGIKAWHAAGLPIEKVPVKRF